MRSVTIQAFISLILAGSLTWSTAAGAAIGIAMASGPFQINHSEVKGNASLFDGSEVRTGPASSKLRLTNGARLELGTDSQAKVYASRAVLVKGSGQVASSSRYGLEARSILVTASDPKSIARVQLYGPRSVRVSAVNGPVRVTNSSGVLLASLASGGSLNFTPQAEGAKSYEVSGCVLKKAGHFIVVDQTTNQVFEVRGLDLNSSLGNRAMVKGTELPDSKPLEGATQAFLGQSSTMIAPGGCLATAAAVGADPLPGTSVSPAAPVKAKAGVNKAVIVGVIVGGGAAAGAAIALSSKSSNKSQ